MLLAFVLLGRAIEERAKLQASSDMTALLNFLPSTARLLVNGSGDSARTMDIPCGSLSVGDLVLVLPGVSTSSSWLCRVGLIFCHSSVFGLVLNIL